MDFFGVGAFEILFLLILAFIILGPERLQATARAAGRAFAQLLAWQQQSPEAQMIQQVQRDFEREIIELRDEFLRTRKQLDVSAEVQQLRAETQSLLNNAQGLLNPRQLAGGLRATGNPSTRDPATTSTVAVPKWDDQRRIGGGPPAPAVEDDLLAHLLREDEAQRQQPAQPAHDTQPLPPPVEVQTVPRKSSAAAANGHSNGQSQQTKPPQPELSVLAQQEQLAHQVAELVSDLRALQEHLRARGLLEPDWLPPTHAAQHETIPS